MSWVYFISEGWEHPIKIGKAANVPQRLRELQVSSPAKLIILGQMPGGRDHEHALHVRFREHRLNGEWFSPAPSLTALIRSLPPPPVETKTPRTKGPREEPLTGMLAVKLSAMTLCCPATVRHWARGDNVNCYTRIRLERACKKLGIRIAPERGPSSRPVDVRLPRHEPKPCTHETRVIAKDNATGRHVLVCARGCDDERAQRLQA